MCERHHVFRETGTTVTNARIDKLISNPRIGAYADPYLLDIGPVEVGNIRQFVHETDLGCQHRVGRILRQFGRCNIHQYQLVMIATERLVQILQVLGCPLTVRADDDAIRFQKIANRRPFFEKLRI